MAGLSRFELLILPCLFVSAASCSKPLDDIIPVAVEAAPDTIVFFVKPDADPRSHPTDPGDEVTVTPFAELNYIHQSSAVCDDYVFIVRSGRSSVCMFDLVKKVGVYTFSQRVEDSQIYHCNQSSFGVEKFEPSDRFPLLYISQRTRSEKRCFTEVFRIIPLFDADSLLLAFRMEKVQEIIFPPMSRENAMGNVNCVIDPVTGKMYTYSRNNDAGDDNYHQCRISRFTVPDVHRKEVILEDSDIELSFTIDVDAVNMQGGCIMDDRLYIAQGFPAAGYVYMNVVDLLQKKLITRYDLLRIGVSWEPEGCFYYDGSIMLSHSKSICQLKGL